MRTALIAALLCIIGLVLFGRIGDQRHPTAEKGEALLQVFTDGAVAMHERVLK